MKIGITFDLKDESRPVRADGPAVHAPRLTGRDWINSQPLTPDSLSGRVVLVEFWAFECINCIHRSPPV